MAWLHRRAELELIVVASCDGVLCQPSVLSVATAAQFAETAQLTGQISSLDSHRSIMRSSEPNRF